MASRIHAFRTFGFPLMALACGQAGTSLNVPVNGGLDSSGPLTTEKEALVGVLQENVPESYSHPSSYCLDDGHVWEGAKARVGRTNLFGVGLASVKSGSVVIAWGEQKQGLLSKLVQKEQCPENFGGDAMAVQVRSDWICDEGWPMSTRDSMRSAAYFEATQVQELDLIDLRAEGSRFKARLKNPFSVDVSGLELVLQYERLESKPVSRSVTRPLSMARGATVTVEDILGEIQEGSFKYGLDAVFVRGSVGKVRFDLRVAVPKS